MAAPVAVVVCGFIGLGILVWGSRRRPAGQQAVHPRRNTLGWALILAFCVGLSLLRTHVQVSSGLTLVVSAAACVVPSAFALWVTQQNQNRAVGQEPRQEDLAALLKAFFAAAQVGVRGPPAAQEASRAPNVAVLKPAGQGAETEVGPNTLADARQVVQDLRVQVGALRSGVLSAVLEYGPGQDWRLLLPGPQDQLESVITLLDQLGRTRNRWAEFGPASFAITDTLAAARRAAATLGSAMDERTSGRPARTDLAEAARRLDHVAGQLAELLDSAVPGP